MSKSKALEGREAAWVVKGRPDRNDLEEMLRPGRLGRWVTRRPPRDWLDGDLVFIWEGAPTLAVCGLAEIVRVEPGDKTGNTFFWLRYRTGYLAQPVSVRELRLDRLTGEASFLKSGAAGTVFPLSRSEAGRLVQLVTRANPSLPSLTRQRSRREQTAGLALSIRQPWVEQILQGTKTEELRSFPTHKRGRITLYASLKSDHKAARGTRRHGLDQLPTGVLVGTVEVVGCRKRGPRDYAWVLRRPVRFERVRKPKKRAQPSFFLPF